MLYALDLILIFLTASSSTMTLTSLCYHLCFIRRLQRRLSKVLNLFNQILHFQKAKPKNLSLIRAIWVQNTEGLLHFAHSLVDLHTFFCIDISLNLWFIAQDIDTYRIREVFQEISAQFKTLRIIDRISLKLKMCQIWMELDVLDLWFGQRRLAWAVLLCLLQEYVGSFDPE